MEKRKGNIYYTTQRGKKTALVFVHGLTSHAGIWQGIVPAFSDHTRICYEIRGHYRSQAKGEYSIEMCVKDLREILDQEKIQKAIFIGQCLGVYIILSFLQKYPKRVEGIVSLGGNYQNSIKNFFPFSLSPFLGIITTFFSLVGTLSRNIHYTIAPMSYQECRRAPEAYLYFRSTLCTLPKTWAQYNKAMLQADYSNVLKKMSVPMLIMVGENDHTFPVRISKAMYHLCGSRGKYLVIIPHEGHSVFIKSPHKVTLHLRRFLDELEKIDNRTRQNSN